jgi:hypothetical protein
MSTTDLVLAAKWFTASNLGQSPAYPKSEKDIEKIYKRCQQVHASEGIEIDDQYDDFYSQLQKKDKWLLAEWNNIKAKMTE